MGVKSCIPSLVAKDSIKLDERWVFLFIAPSKFSVLKMDFLELTNIQGVSKLTHEVAVEILVIAVTSPVNKIKISKSNSHFCCIRG